MISIPNKEYHEHGFIGSTGIKLLNRSPLHYWSAYVNPDRVQKEPTAAMKIGTAWHTAIFEPIRFEDEYVRIPEGLDGRTKEVKALFAEIKESGKEPMAAVQYDTIMAMRESSLAHPITNIIFNDYVGYPEMSFFAVEPESKVGLKIRPDYLLQPNTVFKNGLIIDGKTMENCSPKSFAKEAIKWDMHVQAAFYIDTYQLATNSKEKPTFVWLAQEKEVPYACAYYVANEEMIAAGRKIYRRAIEIYKNAIASNKWPGYSPRIDTVSLPAWALKEIEES